MAAKKATSTAKAEPVKEVVESPKKVYSFFDRLMKKDKEDKK